MLQSAAMPARGCGPACARWIHLVCAATLLGGFQILLAPGTFTLPLPLLRPLITYRWLCVGLVEAEVRIFLVLLLSLGRFAQDV